MAVPADIMGKKGGGAMQTIQDAKILVVDDNRELRNLIKEELTGAGYRAVRMAACSGRFGAEATSPYCSCPPGMRTATGCSVWGWGRMII